MSDWKNWDSRYDRPDYLFGTAPADFLPAQARHLDPASNILAVADGEGRNSVWLASQGHHVTAFDPSAVALGKAGALASDQGAEVQFHQAGIDDWDWAQPYDAVAAIFIQFADPDTRTRLFADIARAIRPGGLLLLHGYAPRQVGYGTGGPPHAENMYTLDLLHRSFPGWEVLHEADEDRHVAEGSGHHGTSALIDFVARKPMT